MFAFENAPLFFSDMLKQCIALAMVIEVREALNRKWSLFSLPHVSHLH